MQIAILKSDAHKVDVEKIRKEFGAEQIGTVEYQLADQNLKAQLDEVVYSYPHQHKPAYLDTWVQTVFITVSLSHSFDN